MCANYVPVTRRERLLTYFGVDRNRDDAPADTWPVNVAPFIRLAEPGSGNARVADDGLFGLLPAFATEVGYGRRTYNARSETVARLPSFRDAWAKGWRCIIPAEAIYEPCWETGRAVRWAIYQEGAVPFGIAGIYSKWRDPQTNREVFSFAMLTVNADGHPVMQRFHRPEDEKRMVVILHPADYADWLACPVEEAPRFFRRWEGPLVAEPLPLPPRAPQAGSVRTVRPPKPAAPKPPPAPEPPETGQLF
jgi:putative SOS response-associated peptidase YedK